MPVTVPLQTNTMFPVRVASAGNCTDSSTARIKVEQKLYIPNAFTQNSDSKNDLNRILPNTSFQLIKFSVYNSWGEKFFSTANINAGWDGTVNNVIQNSGTYIYIISGNDDNGPEQAKGIFLLIW